MSNKPYSQQKDARQKNAAALLHDLWYNAPLSRAMLAKRNRLTKATVSAICDDLSSLNLIQDVGQDRSGNGRPSNLLELNPLARCAIGVEISTNYSAVVLTDLRGQPLWKNAVLIPVGSDRAAALAQSEALTTKAVEHAREIGIPLLGIGVGLPGSVTADRSTLINSPALGWADVPLKRIWEERFSLPVIVENKARAAALAEGLHGSAQGVANFVYVSLGTDVHSSVDAAVIIGGIPYRGAHGLGVDAGHMILDPQGVLCPCGQRGCWQAMADVGREVEHFRLRLAAGESSLLSDAARDSTFEHRAIHQAAVQRDPLALDVVREVLMTHALGIANLVALFDPELVIIGYANAALPDAYQSRMNALSAMPELNIPDAVRNLLTSRGVTPPPIYDAAYGPDACMLGAATLLVDMFLRTPPSVESYVDRFVAPILSLS